MIFSLSTQKGALDSVQLSIYFYIVGVHRERFCYHCEMLDTFNFLDQRIQHLYLFWKISVHILRKKNANKKVSDEKYLLLTVKKMIFFFLNICLEAFQ